MPSTPVPTDPTCGTGKPEPRYRQIVEAAYEGIWCIDDELRTTYVNPRTAEMLGYPLDEMLGRHLFSFMDAEDADLAVASLERQDQGDGERIEFRFRRGDGAELWAMISVNVLRDDAGRPAGNLAMLTEITEQRQAERARREAEEQFRLAFEAAPIGMGLISLDHRFLRVNDALCDMMGYSQADLMAKTFEDITHPDDVDADVAQMQRLLSGEIDGYRREKRYFNAQGHIIWGMVSATLMHDAEGAPVHFIAQVVDISDRKRLEQRLSFLADHDGLTGLRNRRLFERDLAAQVRRCERYGEHALLLMLDLDDFKAINDSYGHATGDEVLKAVADALSARVRTSDLVARLGGDEFAILMPHISPDRIAGLAEDVRDAVNRIEVRVGDCAIHPAVSVGAAVIDDRARSDEAILAIADQTMYRDKQARHGHTAARARWHPLDPVLPS